MDFYMVFIKMSQKNVNEDLVYKFLPPERIEYLKDSLLRFSPPGAMNDPFECLPAYSDELAIDTLETWKRDLSQMTSYQRKQFTKNNKLKIPTTIKEMREMYYKHATDYGNKTFGIFSLTREWKISLMWSHYTTSHTGFCIGFKRDHQFFKRGLVDLRDPNDPSLKPVIYTDERTITEPEPTSTQLKKIYYTKAKEWKYEQEERLVRMLKDADKTENCKPFNLALFKVPLDSIFEIIIGVNANLTLVAAIIHFGRKQRIPIYQAELSASSFNLSRRKLFKPK